MWDQSDGVWCEKHQEDMTLCPCLAELLDKEQQAMYWNRENEPITQEEHEKLYADLDYRKFLVTKVGPREVSTVWTGTSHGEEPPEIFESCIFPARRIFRDHTEADARRRHLTLVQYLSAMDKTYLGDSVYAEWSVDTGHIMLTTENGFGPTNTIVLEPEVLQALGGYLQRLRRVTASLLEGPGSDDPS